MKSLRILVTNNTLAGRAGSEMSVWDLVVALKARGHQPLAYSNLLGEVAEGIRQAGVPVVDHLDAVPWTPDLIHGHHHMDTMTALVRFPKVPAVYFCRGWMPWEETPPLHPRIVEYVAVDQTTLEKAIEVHGIPPQKIRLILNGVDLKRFTSRAPLPTIPTRAVAFSNYTTPAFLFLLEETCHRKGISLDVIGASVNRVAAHPEKILGDYDLVFAKSKAALEALAVGTAVIVCHTLIGMGSMVTTDNVHTLRPLHFGAQELPNIVQADLIAREIDRYDADDAAAVSRTVRTIANLEDTVDSVMALYEEVLETYAPDDIHPDSEATQTAAYFRGISRYVKDQKRKHNGEQQALWTALHTEKTAHKTSQTTYDEWVRRLEEDKAILTKTVRDLEQKKATLETENACQSASINHLESEKRVLAETMRDREREKAALETENTHLRTVVDTLEEEKETTQAHLAYVQRNRQDALRSSLSRTAYRLRSLRRMGVRGTLGKVFGSTRSSSPIQVYIDHPVRGSVVPVSQPVYVRGWAFSSVGSIEKIDVFIGEHSVGTLQHGMARPDVAAAFPHAVSAGSSGFEQEIDLPDVAAGDHELVLRVVDGAGNHRRVQLGITLVASVPEASSRRMARKGKEPRRRRDEGARRARRTSQRHPETTTDRAIQAFLGDYQTRAGQQPSILDWNTGLSLKGRFPEMAIASPPAVDPRPLLPYLDHSIDVVFSPSSEPAFLAEARRVASGAVLTLDAPSKGVPEPHIRIAWQPELETAGALPNTSIIIPVYNQVAFTTNCLEQLRRTLPDIFDGEVIVIDDGSTDETPALLETLAQDWPALVVICNPENIGFVGSCNRGAAAATGTFLLFLNNDTLPQPGWFVPLIRTFEHYPNAGAVGGKLVYPNGTLQEAGGIIFSDGSGWNFGRNDPAIDHPLYNHVREVDYCSGALLATRRDVFLSLGGFDTRYQPAYYEDTDYCFALRQRGYKVYYQPESVVIHFEGISSGTDISSGVKRHQAINKQHFVEKWRHALAHQPPPPPDLTLRTKYRLVVRDKLDDGEVYAY